MYFINDSDKFTDIAKFKKKINENNESNNHFFPATDKNLFSTSFQFTIFQICFT